MKQLLLAALTLAAMSSAAFAQPLTLAESQLDEVTAGAATTQDVATNVFASFQVAQTYHTVAVLENSSVNQSLHIETFNSPPSTAGFKISTLI